MDEAWKEFFRVHNKSCKELAVILCGEQYRDRIMNAEIEELSTSSKPATGAEVFADCNLKLTVYLAKTNKMHLEFQSSHDKHIAMRTLDYDMPLAIFLGEQIVDGISYENYQMPLSFILYVNPDSPPPAEYRCLRLFFGDETVVIQYPMVNMAKRITEYKEMYDAEDIDTLRKAVYKFVRRISPYAEDDELIRLANASAALINKKIFTYEGLSAEESKKEVTTMGTVGMLTFEERWEQKGAEERQSNLASIMKALSCSMEDALLILSGENACWSECARCF